MEEFNTISFSAMLSDNAIFDMHGTIGDLFGHHTTIDIENSDISVNDFVEHSHIVDDSEHTGDFDRELTPDLLEALKQDGATVYVKPAN